MNDCRQEIDLGRMPQVTDRLELHNLSKLTDLSGMRSPGPHTLQLDNLQGLTSLNGIRELIGDAERQRELYEQARRASKKNHNREVSCRTAENVIRKAIAKNSRSTNGNG